MGENMEGKSEFAIERTHSGTINESFHCITVMKCQFGRPEAIPRCRSWGRWTIGALMIK